MSAINEIDKSLARSAATAFGGKPTVTRYWDDDKRTFIDLLNVRDAPQRSVTAFSTVGLSGHRMGVVNAPNLGVELVGACGSNFQFFGNALATAAFCVINSGWVCAPGVVFPDVLKMYTGHSTMPHFAFFPPFLWEGKLETLRYPQRTVTWLLAVPISEAERQFSESNGSQALEDLFAEKQIDIFNLTRSSVA